MRNKNRIIKEFSEFGLEKITTNRFVFHKSNPIFRNEIDKNGLVPKKGEQWLNNSKITKPAIFLTNSYEPSDWFESTYNDDIWKVDTHSINNTFFKDPNFNWGNFKHILTFDSIPRKSITLYHRGSGTDLIN